MSELDKACEKQKRNAKFEWTADKAREFRDIPIEDLLFGEYFLNYGRKELWPRNADELIEMFEDRRRDPQGTKFAVFNRPIGTGKTTIASAVTWLNVYFNITPYPTPQQFLGMKKGSKLAYVIMNINQQLSREVTFDDLLPLFAGSGFFQDYFPPSVRPEDLVNVKRKPRDIRFPNNFYIFPGQVATGFNPLGYTFDEFNRWEVVERSDRARAGLEYDAAQLAVDDAVARMNSRWSRLGYWPGMIVMVGSVNYAGDILDRMTVDPPEATYVSTGSYWDFMPPGTYGDEYFEFDSETMKIKESGLLCVRCGKGTIEIATHSGSQRQAYCPACKTRKGLAA